MRVVVNKEQFAVTSLNLLLPWLFYEIYIFLPSFLSSAPVMVHQLRKISTQIGWSLCGSPSFINAAVNLALLSRILKIC